LSALLGAFVDVISVNGVFVIVIVVIVVLIVLAVSRAVYLGEC
jgi:hypothetical protein